MDGPQDPRHAGTAPARREAEAAPARTWPVKRLLAWAAGLALVLWFFDPLTTVLLGVLGAGALASALAPLRDRLPFGRASGVVAGLVPPLLLVAVLGGIGWLAASQVEIEQQSWREVVDSINGKLAQWSSSLGLQTAPTVSSLAERARDWIDGEGVASAAGALWGILVAVVLVGFGTMYLLSENTADWSRRVIRWLLPHRHERVWEGLGELPRQLRHWVVGTLVSMTVTGLAAGTAFWIVGLPLPLTLGLLAGCAEIVPTFGPVAAFLVAGVVAATQSWSMLLGVAIAYSLIQLLESYVVLPLVMKRAVRLPAIVTLFTVVLWGKVFGIAGLVLAIPIDLLIINLLPRLRDGRVPAAASREAA